MDGYLLGSYRIATAPEPNSNRLTSFRVHALRQSREQRRPLAASVGCTTNSYSSINPSYGRRTHAIFRIGRDGASRQKGACRPDARQRPPAC
jgi:hypothetical protein